MALKAIYKQDVGESGRGIFQLAPRKFRNHVLQQNIMRLNRIYREFKLDAVSVICTC
jgi:hypothetical protein